MSYPRYRSQSVPAVELDDATKSKFRKHVQGKYHPEFLDLGKQREAALSAAGDEEERQRAQRQYTESVDTLRLLADEEYHNLVRHEVAKRAGAERGRQPESVLQEQQVWTPTRTFGIRSLLSRSAFSTVSSAVMPTMSLIVLGRRSPIQPAITVLGARPSQRRTEQHPSSGAHPQ